MVVLAIHFFFVILQNMVNLHEKPYETQKTLIININH